MTADNPAVAQDVVEQGAPEHATEMTNTSTTLRQDVLADFLRSRAPTPEISERPSGSHGTILGAGVKRQHKDDRKETIDSAWEHVQILWIKMEMAFRARIRESRDPTIGRISRDLDQMLTEMDKHHFSSGRINVRMARSICLFWQRMGVELKRIGQFDEQYEAMSLAFEHLREIAEGLKTDEQPRKIARR